MLTAFEQVVSPLFHRILANTEQSATLAALRDALLPKLISGELWVKDAERVVADPPNQPPLRSPSIGRSQTR